MPEIEVFADVTCPFAHVGLRRLIERRAARHRDDVRILVRAWPLEVVNGEPLDAGHIDDEVTDIRGQVAPDLFRGFTEEAFPSTSLPALALTAAAYRTSLVVGERVALRLRELLFEEGVDVSDPEVLAAVAAEEGVVGPIDDTAPVLVDHAEGEARGVIGSPHFFVDGEGAFCPILDVGRDADGHLRVGIDDAAMAGFLDRCFA